MRIVSPLISTAFLYTPYAVICMFSHAVEMPIQPMLRHNKITSVIKNVLKYVFVCLFIFTSFILTEDSNAPTVCSIILLARLIATRLNILLLRACFHRFQFL